MKVQICPGCHSQALFRECSEIVEPGDLCGLCADPLFSSVTLLRTGAVVDSSDASLGDDETYAGLRQHHGRGADPG